MPSSVFSHRSPKCWTKITVDLAPELVESAAEFLTELCPAGVEIVAGGPDSGSETMIGYLEMPGPGNSVAKEDVSQQLGALERALEGLGGHFPGTPVPAMVTELVEEEDWSGNWKKHFKPFHISPHLVIKPSWEEYQPQAGEAVIELDPGLAFGTGHHASTRLALQLIDALFQEHGTPPGQVLDMGCGTAILGLACALFGAARVVALDNDPDAVAVARENVIRNNQDRNVAVSGRELADLVEPFELIVANITHDVLSGLAPDLVGHLAAGGHLVLAGILASEQEESIVALYTALGLQVVERQYQDEWVALLFAGPKAPQGG